MRGVKTRLAMKLLRMAARGEGAAIEASEARIALAELAGHDSTWHAPPTEIGLEIMDVIRQHQKELGMSPTYQELADLLDRSVATVHEHVDTLVERGHLTRAARRKRSLAFTQWGVKALLSYNQGEDR